MGDKARILESIFCSADAEEYPPSLTDSEDEEPKLGREKDGGSLPLSGPVADVGSLSASALLMPSSNLPAVDIGFAVPGEEATAEREAGPADDRCESEPQRTGEIDAGAGGVRRVPPVTATSGRPGTTLRHATRAHELNLTMAGGHRQRSQDL